jgi:hypothetical protein
VNRATIMKTTAFRRHLMEGKRFYEGYVYQTNRKTYHVYTPEYRVWIDKKGKCWTYSLTEVPTSHQNPTGTKITPTPVKPPAHVDILALRTRIMKDLGLKDLPSDRANPGPRAKKNPAVAKQPKEVIEAIHQAAVKAGETSKGPQLVPVGGWPTEPPGDTNGAVPELPERAPEDGYENTQDYDVLRLITDLWSRCGGSAEDLEWAREQFVEIGFLLPEVETQAVITMPGGVSLDELVADMEAMGYKIRPA